MQSSSVGHQTRASAVALGLSLLVTTGCGATFLPPRSMGPAELQLEIKGDVEHDAFDDGGIYQNMGGLIHTSEPLAVPEAPGHFLLRYNHRTWTSSARQGASLEVDFDAAQLVREWDLDADPTSEHGLLGPDRWLVALLGAPAALDLSRGAVAWHSGGAGPYGLGGGMFGEGLSRPIVYDGYTIMPSIWRAPDGTITQVGHVDGDNGVFRIDSKDGSEKSSESFAFRVAISTEEELWINLDTATAQLVQIGTGITRGRFPIDPEDFAEKSSDRTPYVGPIELLGGPPWGQALSGRRFGDRVALVETTRDGDHPGSRTMIFELKSGRKVVDNSSGALVSFQYPCSAEPAAADNCYFVYDDDYGMYIRGYARFDADAGDFIVTDFPAPKGYRYSEFARGKLPRRVGDTFLLSRSDGRGLTILSAASAANMTRVVRPEGANADFSPRLSQHVWLWQDGPYVARSDARVVQLYDVRQDKMLRHELATTCPGVTGRQLGDDVLALYTWNVSTQKMCDLWLIPAGDGEPVKVHSEAPLSTQYVRTAWIGEQPRVLAPACDARGCSLAGFAPSGEQVFFHPVGAYRIGSDAPVPTPYGIANDGADKVYAYYQVGPNRARIAVLR